MATPGLHQKRGVQRDTDGLSRGFGGCPGGAGDSLSIVVVGGKGGGLPCQ
jgi:hypothetical protein